MILNGGYQGGMLSTFLKTMYNDNGFIGGYCTFSYMFLAHYARCRDAGEAVEMTLRECLEKGILI